MEPERKRKILKQLFDVGCLFDLLTNLETFKKSFLFGILEAQVASAKAAYLAAIIITDCKGELQKFSPSIPLAEYMVTHPEYNFLNKRLKFVASGEALFYWFQTIKLLEHGLG